MQTAVQNSRHISVIQEINVDAVEQTNCFQIREKLDALFDGDSRLEEAHRELKRVLFGHLETCEQCCRAFDVRVCFRRGSGRGIL